MVTIRQQLLEALKTRLESQISDDVHIGRTVFDPDVDKLPLITILARTDTSVVSAYRTNKREMPIDIAYLISFGGDQDAGKETYKDVSEVCEPAYGTLEKACFHGGQIQLGDNFYSIEFRGGGIGDYPSEPGPAIVTVGVSLAVTYETNIGDPET